MIIPALFVASSVLRQAGPSAAEFEIVIVTDPYTVGEYEADWMSHFGIQHKIIDFEFLKTIFDKPGRLTSATLVKLTLAHIFADQYDRILYLDSDLTIHADLSVLFKLALDGNAVAANRRAIIHRTEADKAAAEAHFSALGMTRPFHYFNSGVLLIDVDAWNGQDLTFRSLDFIAQNRELCQLPDEDSLNAVLNGRFTALSPVWNMPPRRPPFMQFHELADPAIIHYSGDDKPWKRFGRDKPLFPDIAAYHLYRNFTAGSPWDSWLERQWNLKDVRDAIISSVRRQYRIWRRGSPETSRQWSRVYARHLYDHVAQSDYADIRQGFAFCDGARLGVNRGGPGPTAKI